MLNSGLNAVLTFSDASSVSASAAQHIVEELRRKPDVVICAATGASPLGTYQELGRVAARNPEVFRSVRLIKLDEWGGLVMDHPATCEFYLRKHLIEPLGIAEDRYIGFQSNPADPNAECARVAEAIQRWGAIDVCVLGIGLNGHLGLNEPAPALTPDCHVAELSEVTKGHGMLAANGAAPRYGMTLGIGDILRSRKIILIALGAAKREPIMRMWSQGVTTDFPASFLRLHPNTLVYTDAAASCGESNS
ncbi:MAG: 6-phosphogluconolactonase [Candidatus Hydrogenedentes bacterium]|nr:6-phosphogluconolactonase [Candidatus Hydrogenedentota bacterium]